VGAIFARSGSEPRLTNGRLASKTSFFNVVKGALQTVSKSITSGDIAISMPLISVSQASLADFLECLKSK
jgi:hypothetical protein